MDKLQEEQEYQAHYSPDGEYIEYLMEHPEMQEKPKNKMTKSNKEGKKKCICGHYEKDHGYYDNRGRNVNNCPWVCHKDGCNMWAYCDLRT